MSEPLLDPPLRGTERIVAPAVLAVALAVAVLLLMGGEEAGAPPADDPTVLADDFERPDAAESLGEGPVPWVVEAGSWGIAGGAAAPHENFGLWMFATYQTGVADHEIGTTIGSARDGAGLAVRFVDPINFWAARTDGADRWRLTVVVEGEEETVGEVLGPAGDGVTASLRSEGADVVLVVDGEELLRLDDPRHAGATRVGLTATGDDYVSVRFDDAWIVPPPDAAPPASAAVTVPGP